MEFGRASLVAGNCRSPRTAPGGETLAGLFVAAYLADGPVVGLGIASPTRHDEGSNPRVRHRPDRRGGPGQPFGHSTGGGWPAVLAEVTPIVQVGDGRADVVERAGRQVDRVTPDEFRAFMRLAYARGAVPCIRCEEEIDTGFEGPAEHNPGWSETCRGHHDSELFAGLTDNAGRRGLAEIDVSGGKSQASRAVIGAGPAHEKHVPAGAAEDQVGRDWVPVVASVEHEVRGGAAQLSPLQASERFRLGGPRAVPVYGDAFASGFPGSLVDIVDVGRRDSSGKQLR